MTSTPKLTTTTKPQQQQQHRGSSLMSRLVTNITQTIDRIEVMVRRAELGRLIDFLNGQCKRQKLDTSKHDTTKYDVVHHKDQDSLITTKIPLLLRTDVPLNNQWAYVSVSDPNDAVQAKIKQLCWYLGGTKGWPNAVVKEIEVAVDLFTDSESHAEQLWRYLGKHLFTIGSRPNSYNRVKSTRYVGRNGNIRNGSHGTRCYVKEINGRYACRLEAQYNRPFLIKHKITHESLPIKPESLPVLDKLVFLHSFTDRGVKNYAKGILRKRGVMPTDSTYRTELRKEEAYVRHFVLGGKRGADQAVHKQIAALKELNKEHGLSINVRAYFEEIAMDKELIFCLNDIGKQEELCSKRIVAVES